MKAHLRHCISAALMFTAAVSSRAQATVIYSEHFQVLAPRSLADPTDRYDLDVNGDAVPDVRFDYKAFEYGGILGGPSQGSLTGLNGAAIAAPDGLGFSEHVNHFVNGEVVGPDVTFSPAGTRWPLEREAIAGYNLIWSSASGPHFMGLRLPLADGDHYAWVRISHDQWLLPDPANTSAAGTLTIYSMAYESVPGIPITIPEPTAGAALVALAVASFGRRRCSRRAIPPCTHPMSVAP